MNKYLIKLPRGTKYWSIDEKDDNIIIFPEDTRGVFTIQMEKDTAQQIYEILHGYFGKE